MLSVIWRFHTFIQFLCINQIVLPLPLTSPLHNSKLYLPPDFFSTFKNIYSQKAKTCSRNNSQCYYWWLLSQPALTATLRESSLITYAFSYKLKFEGFIRMYRGSSSDIRIRILMLFSVLFSRAYMIRIQYNVDNWC